MRDYYRIAGCFEQGTILSLWMIINIFSSLKELEDCTWFPHQLRKYQTDYIGFVVSRLNIYDGFVNYLRSCAQERIPMEDLCSGNGEAAATVFNESGCFTELFLSDKFPNREEEEVREKISYKGDPVDVLDMEFHAGRCYTMFNAFHHFSNAEKLEITRKIISSGSSAFIVEPLESGLICLGKVILSSTIGCLLLTPFIRPYSFMRLIFTYLVPLNLLTITIDGIISVFKSKTALEYQHLFAECGEVKISRIKNYLMPLVVIRIQPAK